MGVEKWDDRIILKAIHQVIFFLEKSVYILEGLLKRSCMLGQEGHPGGKRKAYPEFSQVKGAGILSRLTDMS